jgi:hypothetical protein
MRRSRERRKRGFMQRMKRNWKLPVGLGLAAVVTAAVVVWIPTVASAGKSESGHALHAEHAEAAQDELAGLRQATARFHDLDKALAEGYELGYLRNNGVRIITGCVASPTAGAMGYHYFNKALVDDVAVDPLKPEVLVYAPTDDGLKLAAVEWVVPGPIWTDPPGVSDPPSVYGMDMHILVPAVGFWLMHAWIWKPNPAGIFADFNPNVSCS